MARKAYDERNRSTTGYGRWFRISILSLSQKSRQAVIRHRPAFRPVEDVRAWKHPRFFLRVSRPSRPLAVKLDAGMAVLFRYGVAVLLGASPDACFA
jgi:hypothetical protein